ncbi:thioesterase II family protein [Zwartia vadi]|uniref:thioesterase II family protein n=1 Tax=Zwartia vadi TaxID=3058168 RepID=UPI0025B59FFC|nr:alpha/beta fold hydrolase [Zwartia vadi]MDN3988594.1 alpha/beta fold hydrolase [Zwartia vadi]
MTSTQSKPSSWLVPLSRHTNSKLTIFCFPYAGAGASIYRNWGKLFPDHVDMYAIQAPGRETRFSEPFVRDIAEFAIETAAAIQKTTEQPVVLFGHSLGAACAYETARALERAGQTPELLIVSGRQCPGTASKRAPIAHLSDKQFLAHVLAYKGTPAAVLENEELIELLLPLLRADFGLAENYRPSIEPLLTCPIIGLGSTEDEWLDRETLEKWGELTKGNFETHWFEGDHFYLNHQTKELVTFLREKISVRSQHMDYLA